MGPRNKKKRASAGKSMSEWSKREDPGERERERNWRTKVKKIAKVRSPAA